MQPTTPQHTATLFQARQNKHRRAVALSSWYTANFRLRSEHGHRTPICCHCGASSGIVKALPRVPGQWNANKHETWRHEHRGIASAFSNRGCEVEYETMCAPFSCCHATRLLLAAIRSVDSCFTTIVHFSSRVLQGDFDIHRV